MAAQSALSHIWNHLQSQFSKPVKSRSSSSLWNTSPDVPHSSNTLVYFCAWVMLWFKQTVFYLHSTYLHEHKQTVEFWKTVHCCRICIQWILELVQRRILSFLLASQGIWRCVYSLKILKRENVHAIMWIFYTRLICSLLFFSKLCGLRSGKATKTCLRLNLDRIKKKCSAVSERKALKFCNLLKFRKWTQLHAFVSANQSPGDAT